MAVAISTLILFLAAMPEPAFAEDTLSAGDTAWMMTSTALVLLMTIPGVALFYGNSHYQATETRASA